MNMKRIDEAIAHYSEAATPEEAARYAFFKGLWELQNAEAKRLAEHLDYRLASPEVLEEQYWGGQAAIASNPVSIAAANYAALCKQVADYMAEHAGLDENIAKVLASYDWDKFVSNSAFELAGREPAAYIEDCLRRINVFEVDTACPANVFMMVPSFALRPFFQTVAAQTMDALKDVKKNQLYHNKPLHCPVCGSLASASYVGGGLELESHGRMLYCAMCGAEWAFERIRCAKCGTRNQGHLHWVHVEGDSAHRLHLCDECGGYTRTVFQDDLHAAVCMPVEDVVMARLDEVAQTLT